MKKAISVLLVLAIAVSLAACGSQSSAPSAGQSDSSATASPATASNGEWPNKAITLLCGYSAGGSSDLGSRYLAEALKKELGVPVVVENVPGSGSWLAWNQLLQNTDPDGYTFALVNLSALYGHYDATNPREKTIEDFELLANHVVDYQVLAIRSDETRFTDYSSLIEYAKNNPLILASATSSITSGDATVAKFLEQKHGSQLTVIPVDGASDATTMFLAGETDILSANVGDVMEAEENGYRPIVVFAPERSEYLPDVPTAIEIGVDDYVSFSARGYAYMKGVDPAIVEKMTNALIKSFNDPDYQKNMAAMGAQLELYTGEEYYNLLMDQLDSRLELWKVQK
ncbi:tripartite tricarboxylate transporter substrate-binding protein [Oscillospiraceae bacterium LTW-04]|nr:tripartite tricarboxylate transporter substrate binding protein [Oscillospiraceae bacterium MB24-C1]